jgi:serine/threonine protein kinase
MLEVHKLATLLVQDLQLLSSQEWESLCIDFPNANAEELLLELRRRPRCRLEHRLVVMVTSFVSSRLLAGLSDTLFIDCPDEPNQPPRRFVALDEIKSGGQGVVRLACELGKLLDPTPTVFYAIKTPLDASLESLHRALTEINVLRRVRHENLVEYIAADESSGTLVVKYVEGIELTKYIEKRRRLSVRDSIQVSRQIAAALSALHQDGVEHRDVKPGNILVSPQGKVLRCTLLDVGLAVIDPDSPHLFGTPHYYPPELISKPESLDQRADFYGLAATIFTCLVGHPPNFQSCINPKKFLSLRAKQDEHRWTYSEPPIDCDVESIREDVPHHLAKLIMQGLSRTPSKRPTIVKWNKAIDELERDARLPLAIDTELRKLTMLLLEGYKQTLKEKNLNYKQDAALLLLRFQSLNKDFSNLYSLRENKSYFCLRINRELLIPRTRRFLNSISSLIQRLKVVCHQPDGEIAVLLLLDCLDEFKKLAGESTTLAHGWFSIAETLGYAP